MYHSSTQKAHWTFHSLDEIQAAWDRVAEEYSTKMGLEMSDVLSGGECRGFCCLVGETGLKFCYAFRPQMPASVIWTAFTYFHRFYTRYSPLEWGPRNVIMGCLYLACKVEEFNITAEDFVKNLKNGSPESNLDILLTHEPLLMRKLDYHLTVHGPYRPLEGHLINLKTHGCTGLEDAEGLRAACSAFLDKAILSPVALLFPPSQIALAALDEAAREYDVNLEEFFSNCLLPHYPDGLTPLVNRLREIQRLVEMVEVAESDAEALRKRVADCAKMVTEREVPRERSEDRERENSIDSDDD